MTHITRRARGPVLLGALAALTFAFQPAEAPAQTVEGPDVFWKLSTWGNPRAFTEGIEFVAQKVEEATGGKFRIQIFYGEQLSSAAENLDGLKVNAFEAAMFCNFYHPGKTPASMVITLPFLPLGDFDVAARVRHGLYEHPVFVEEMAQWNAIYYGSAHLPQYEFMGRGEPPVTLDGWQGMRVRAGGGLGMAMETLGAVRQSMPATEVYTAVQRGVVDAASFPYTYSHAAYRIDEVASWFTSNMAPGTTDCPIVFNKTSYEALPAQYQELLWSLRDEMTEVYKAGYAAADAEFLPRFRERLVEVVYDDATLDELRAMAAQPVWAAWVEENKDKFDSQGLLDRLFELAEGGDS